MKRKRSIALLALAFTLALLAAGTVQAKKPLIGAMDLKFNQGWTEPSDEIPDWVGTITIGGDEYGMLFFATGSGKSFDDNLKGKVHFFEEIWAIYETSDFTSLIPSSDADDWAKWLPRNNPDELVLWGYDAGQTNIQTSKYHMTGNVEGANEEFSEWQGRNVYMSGDIGWLAPGVPEFAPGEFRIN